MSLKALTYVWENSKHKSSVLLVLLAIADIADDNGDAYPGVSRLARKARMTERNAQKQVVKLESSGELLVFPNVGLKTASGWTNLYRVVMKGVNDTTPLNSPGVSGGSPHEMSRRSPHGVSQRTPKSSDYPSDQPSDDDDIQILIQWGISKHLKSPKAMPVSFLVNALQIHHARLGAAQFNTVIERCKKRGGRSWDYYLNALRDEAAQPVAKEVDPTDWSGGQYADFIEH